MRLQLILSSLILAPLLNLVQPIGIALSQEKTQEKAELALVEAELLTSLAGDYATIGQKNQAIALLEDSLSLNQSLVEPCPKLRLLAGVAGQYAFVGNKVKSSELFTQARGILEGTEYCGPEPSSSSWSDPTTWISLAFLKHARAGQYDTAFQVATGFGDQYIEPIQNGLEYRNALDDPEWIKLNIALQRKLADFYFRTKEFNKARAIWLALADYYKKKGEPEQVIKLRNLALKIKPTEENNSLNNQSPQEKAQRALFDCFEPLEPHPERELTLINAIWALTSTLRPEELRPLLDICKKEKVTGKNIEVAAQFLQAFEQMSVSARRISAPIKRAQALAAIAYIYGQLKQDSEANKLLGEVLSSLKAAIQFANSLDRGHRDNELLIIVRQYVLIGQHAKALQIAETIEGLEFQNKAEVIYDILTEAIESGNLEWARQATLRLDWKAQATASIMQEVEQASAFSLVYRDRLLLMIAREYAESKQFTQALNTAAQIGVEEFGKVLKAEALSAIARQYAKAGQPKEAAKLLNQAVEIARSISSN